MQKPQKNHRAILNAIREFRKKQLPMRSSNDLVRGEAIIEGMSAIIRRMEVTEAHQEILREWDHLCRELRSTYGYNVAVAIENQKK